MAQVGSRFQEEHNKTYKLPSIDELDEKTLLHFVNKFKREQQERLDTLMKYFLNETEIKHRVKPDEKQSNNKLSHNFSRYITTLVQGYMLGKPITYKHEDEDLLQQITDFNDMNDEQSHNALMELNLSIYGRAFELLYMDSQSMPRLAVLDPRETFMIRDTTVKESPLAGIRFFSVETGEYTDKEFIEVYTKDKVIQYENKNNTLEEQDENEQYFGDVQLIEYKNNYQRTGDFESVIDQIDAYDMSQSDTANEQEDFSNAYLVLQGQPNTDQDDVDGMKDSRVIILDEGVEGGDKPSAYYLVKEYDVQGVESYKNRLVDDIHKLSFTPDLNDSEFAGNISGEAMKYKLFMLDQLIATKERLFKAGVMERYRLLSNIWQIQSRKSDVEDLELVFTHNLPANTSEMVSMARNLQGIISHETQLGILPMVDDVAAEQERIQEETEQSVNDYENQEITDSGNNQNAGVNNG